MKHEYRKYEKDLYTVSKKPELITIPELKFITISGKGNPNNKDFSNRVGTLYSVAFPIKMNFKKLLKEKPELASEYPYQDYTIFPLEGIWTSEDENDFMNKDKFIYTIMIRQPDFITQEMVDEVIDAAKKKKTNPLLNELSFEATREGLCIQMMHIGPFDNESESFEKMDAFALENGYERINHMHREIYMSDFRKTAPERLKTILRFQCKKI